MDKPTLLIQKIIPYIKTMHASRRVTDGMSEQDLHYWMFEAEQVVMQARDADAKAIQEQLKNQEGWTAEFDADGFVGETPPELPMLETPNCRCVVNPFDEKEFNAKRLRRLVNLLNLQTFVPESDDELLSCMGVVIGRVCRKIEESAFQNRVAPWMQKCFGAEISSDRQERNHRFFEEAIELVQACDMTRSEAHQLVDYVFGRPVGQKVQEIGGTMVTLAALCLAQGLDMHEAGEIELARINVPAIVEKIRAKQASKPRHSPLPE